jgi:hypothetical protein
VKRKENDEYFNMKLFFPKEKTSQKHNKRIFCSSRENEMTKILFKRLKLKVNQTFNLVVKQLYLAFGT